MRYVSNRKGWIDENGINIGDLLDYKWVTDDGRNQPCKAHTMDFEYEEIYLDENGFLHHEEGASAISKEPFLKTTSMVYIYHWHGRMIWKYSENG